MALSAGPDIKFNIHLLHWEPWINNGRVWTPWIRLTHGHMGADGNAFYCRGTSSQKLSVPIRKMVVAIVFTLFRNRAHRASPASSSNYIIRLKSLQLKAYILDYLSISEDFNVCVRRTPIVRGLRYILRTSRQAIWLG
jgi:hypothetical protein